MNNSQEADFTLFTLPEGWAKKLFEAEEVPSWRSTSAFLWGLRKALGITQAELSGHLEVDPLMISRWEDRRKDHHCRPRARSEASKTIEDWGRQIYVIQHVSPNEWEVVVPTIKAFNRSGRELSL